MNFFSFVNYARVFKRAIKRAHWSSCSLTSLALWNWVALVGCRPNRWVPQRRMLLSFFQVQRTAHSHRFSSLEECLKRRRTVVLSSKFACSLEILLALLGVLHISFKRTMRSHRFSSLNECISCAKTVVKAALLSVSLQSISRDE